MKESATHRLVKSPKINSRYLSDYMVASERVRRTIIRDCKYQRIARTIQHDRAKLFISQKLKSGELTGQVLNAEGQRLHDMMSDTEFERDTLDINGDFLIAYSETFSMDTFPKSAEIVEPNKVGELSIHGVEFKPDIWFGLRRVTRTNQLRMGFGTIRYAKNKPLDEEVGAYQSSALFGYCKNLNIKDDIVPEQRLCLTLDCVTGKFIPAPSDATRRFQNMEAACATIAERWDNIEPPENAIIA